MYELGPLLAWVAHTEFKDGFDRQTPVFRLAATRFSTAQRFSATKAGGKNMITHLKTKH